MAGRRGKRFRVSNQTSGSQGQKSRARLQVQDGGLKQGEGGTIVPLRSSEMYSKPLRHQKMHIREDTT